MFRPVLFVLALLVCTASANTIAQNCNQVSPTDTECTSVTTYQCAVPQLGTSVVVNGNNDENWGSADFFSDLARSGQADNGVFRKDALGTLYMRYECSTQTVYFMAEAKHPYYFPSTDELFVKINDRKPTLTSSFGTNGNAQLVRWEGSFSVSPGCHKFYLHTNIHDGASQTASTDKANVWINLQECSAEPTCASESFACGTTHHNKADYATIPCGGATACSTSLCCKPNTCSSEAINCGPGNHEVDNFSTLHCGSNCDADCCEPNTCSSETISCGAGKHEVDNYSTLECGTTCSSDCCELNTCSSEAITCGAGEHKVDNYLTLDCGTTCSSSCCELNTCSSEGITCGPGEHQVADFSTHECGLNCDTSCCLPNTCSSESIRCGPGKHEVDDFSTYECGLNCATDCCVPDTCSAGSMTCGAILGLYRTGVDDQGNALLAGQNDPHYRILNPSQQGVVIRDHIPGSWVPNSNTHRWIWQTVHGQPIRTTLFFRLTFDLGNNDPSTAEIKGRWAHDNLASIIINGQAVNGQHCHDQFRTGCPFTISDGFVAGVNHLDFKVVDLSSIGGLVVLSISGTACRPCSPVSTEPVLVVVPEKNAAYRCWEGCCSYSNDGGATWTRLPDFVATVQAVHGLTGDVYALKSDGTKIKRSHSGWAPISDADWNSELLLNYVYMATSTLNDQISDSSGGLWWLGHHGVHTSSGVVERMSKWKCLRSIGDDECHSVLDVV